MHFAKAMRTYQTRKFRQWCCCRGADLLVALSVVGAALLLLLLFVGATAFTVPPRPPPCRLFHHYHQHQQQQRQHQQQLWRAPTRLLDEEPRLDEAPPIVVVGRVNRTEMNNNNKSQQLDDIPPTEVGLMNYTEIIGIKKNNNIINKIEMAWPNTTTTIEQPQGQQSTRTLSSPTWFSSLNDFPTNQKPSSPNDDDDDDSSGTRRKHKTIHVPSLRKQLIYDPDLDRFYEGGDLEKIPIGTIFERTLDTVEDAILHARRIPYDKGWIQHKTDASTKLATIVVLGSGWGAHAFLKVADTYKFRVVVVSPINHFVFTPMLASASVGTVEYRSMTEAVRAANPMIENYIEGSAVDIDVDRQVLTVQLEDLLPESEATKWNAKSRLIEIQYDKLVVAVGCKVADAIVPGAAKYALKLKSCDNARLLRTAVGECLEYASRPDVAPQTNLAEQDASLRQEKRRTRLKFCIVGGGPTGVELAGELSDFFRDCTRDRIGSYFKIKDDISIVLVQGSNDLVPQFEPDLRVFALDCLRDQGVDVRLNTRVKEVGDGWIKLLDKVTGQEETLAVGLTVWAAGVTPVPFINTLLSKLPEAARGSNGRVKVDRWLRCPTASPDKLGSIVVLGDAASFETGEQEYLPQTAQVAGQQGAFVARMLDRCYDLTLTPPELCLERASAGDISGKWLKIRGLEKAAGFKFLNLGLLAYVGKGQALSQVQLGDVPIFSYAGSVSFALWRSVYLVKQVATRNRILVLFDWFKCKVFGRDITRL